MTDSTGELFETEDEQLCAVIIAEKSNLLADLYLCKTIRTAGTMEDPLFCAKDVGRHIIGLPPQDKVKEFFIEAEHKQHIQTCPVMEEDMYRRRMFFTENGLYTFLFRIGTESALEIQSYIFKYLKSEREWAASRTVMTLEAAVCQNRSLRLLCVSAAREARFAQTAAKSAAEKLRQLEDGLLASARVDFEELASRSAAIVACSG